MKRKFILIGALLLLLLLTQSAYAGSSPGYRIDWSNALSGGGKPANSAAYAVYITVGQTVHSAAESPQYKVKMGYWTGIDGFLFYGAYLPVIEKSP